MERVGNGVSKVLWRCSQEGGFYSQMRVRLRGWKIGLEAREGSRHVIYHFSLDRN